MKIKKVYLPNVPANFVGHVVAAPFARTRKSSPKIIITQNHHHVFCDADMVLHFLTLSALSAATP